MAAEPAAHSRDVDAVDALVAGWSRTLARRWSIGRAAWLAAALGLIPLLFVVADHARSGGLSRDFMRGGGVGWLAAVVIGATAVVVISRRRRVNPLYAGKQLESTLEIRHNALLNVIGLQRQTGVADALPSAARQATRALREVVEPPRPPGAVARPAKWALVAITTAWLLYAMLAPKSVWQSLLRFFGIDLAAPTATRLELTRPTPGEVVRAGEPLEVEFAVRGRPVDDVVLSLADAGSANVDWNRPARVISLIAGSTDRGAVHWTAVLAANEVERDIAFVCRAGDAELRGVIPVAPRPELVSLRIALTPPPGRGEPLTTTTRDLIVWPGTVATFAFEANTPVREPLFVFRTGNENSEGDDSAAMRSGGGAVETRTRMSIDVANAAAARATVTLTEAGAYRIEFSDRLNAPFRDAHWYRVELREGATIEEAEQTSEDEVSASGGGATKDDGAKPDVRSAKNADGREAPETGDSKGESGDSEAAAGDADGQTGNATASTADQGAANGEGQSAQSGAGDAGGEPASSAGDADGQGGDTAKGGSKQGSGERGPSSGGASGERGESKSESDPGDRAGQDGERPSAQRGSGTDAPSREPATSNGGAAEAQPGEAKPDGRGSGGGDEASLAPEDESPSPGAAQDASANGGPTPNPGVGRTERPNLLDMLARGETVPESALMDEGLSQEAARSFAGALRRAQEDMRRLGLPQPPPRRSVGTRTPGEMNAQRGAGLARDAGGDAASDAALHEALERITPRAGQAAPPGLQPVLEAYYRSLARVRR